MASTTQEAEHSLTFTQVCAAPLVTLAICTIGLILLIIFRKAVADKLITSFGFNLTYVLVTAVASALGALMLDLIDVSEALENHFDHSFHWQGSVLVFCTFTSLGFILFSAFRDHEVKQLLSESDMQLKINRDHRRRAGEIGKIVATKAKKVHKAARDPEMKMTVTRLGKTLQPDDQTWLNFVGLYACLKGLLPDGAKLRLALYTPSADKMQLELRRSTDGTQPDCITSPNLVHRAKFALNTSDSERCLAAAVSKRGGMYVVRDTSKLTEDEAKRFQFFDDRQQDRIKSIVAFAIEVDDQPPYPVLVADTNQAGGFTDRDECGAQLLRANFQEFGMRLLYEYDLVELFRRGSSNGNSGKSKAVSAGRQGDQ